MQDFMSSTFSNTYANGHLKSVPLILHTMLPGLTLFNA
jgi:hypothetical protein